MVLLSVDLSGHPEAAWLAPQKENRGEQTVISRNPPPREKVLCSLQFFFKEALLWSLPQSVKI